MYKTPDKETITILGEKVPVILSTTKCLELEADGLYAEDGTIYLKHFYDNEEHYRRVFIHESIHALCDILGCQLDVHMEEVLAHRISSMVVEQF